MKFGCHLPDVPPEFLPLYLHRMGRSGLGMTCGRTTVRADPSNLAEADDRIRALLGPDFEAETITVVLAAIAPSLANGSDVYEGLRCYYPDGATKFVDSIGPDGKMRPADPVCLNPTRINQDGMLGWAIGWAQHLLDTFGAEACAKLVLEDFNEPGGTGGAFYPPSATIPGWKDWLKADIIDPVCKGVWSVLHDMRIGAPVTDGAGLLADLWPYFDVAYMPLGARDPIQRGPSRLHFHVYPGDQPFPVGSIMLLNDPFRTAIAQTGWTGPVVISEAGSGVPKLSPAGWPAFIDACGQFGIAELYIFDSCQPGGWFVNETLPSNRWPYDPGTELGSPWERYDNDQRDPGDAGRMALTPPGAKFWNSGKWFDWRPWFAGRNDLGGNGLLVPTDAYHATQKAIERWMPKRRRAVTT